MIQHAFHRSNLFLNSTEATYLKHFINKTKNYLPFYCRNSKDTGRDLGASQPSTPK
jgi:hypothetical protein